MISNFQPKPKSNFGFVLSLAKVNAIFVFVYLVKIVFIQVD